MTPDEIKAALAEQNPEAVLYDGFEDALVGLACQFNTVLACYDRERCIKILMERDGMDEDEAEEYFEFNVAGAYVGTFTPIILHDLRGEHV